MVSLDVGACVPGTNYFCTKGILPWYGGVVPSYRDVVPYKGFIAGGTEVIEVKIQAC